MKFYLLMIIFIFFVSCGSDSDTNNTTSNNNGSSLEIWNTAVAYWKLDEANSGIVSDHVAAVANNTSLDLYIDGALDGSHTIVPIAAYTGPGAIAADGECAQKFIGSIDEVAVWNTSLTAQDIQDVYNEQKP